MFDSNMQDVCGGSGCDEHEDHCRDAHTNLLIHLEQVFVVVRPRLLRLARLCGVPADGLEDVVQETLVAAWLHLDQLRSPEQLMAWLEGICRNQCRVYRRGLRHNGWEDVLLSHLFENAFESGSDGPEGVLPDEHYVDPLEELSRHELGLLLEQALAVLTHDDREILLRCDLVGQSHREVAERLSLSASTLGVRLYRARQRVRRILNSQLRQDAEAYSLPLDVDLSSGWRESGKWCWQCGQQRLRGTLESLSQGGMALRMRCPTCSVGKDQDILFYAPPPSLSLLSGRRTLGPALKHLHKHFHTTLYPYLLQALTDGEQPCLHCQQPVRAKLLGLDGLSSLRVVLLCKACGYRLFVWAGELVCSISTHPMVQQFFAQTQRWITEPDLVVEYEGEPACCFRLKDVVSERRLTVLAYPQTLQIIVAFIEE